MIKLQTFAQDSTSKLINNIWKQNSLLIIGKASDERFLNEFRYPAGVSDMRRIYGDCELTDAYIAAANTGLENIFVMNCFKTSDVPTGLSFALNYNFSFIVFSDIYLSHSFYSTKYGGRMYYAEYCMKEGVNSNTVFIFGEEHAGLYEYMDNYIDDMNKKLSEFKNKNNMLLDVYGSNLAFILNCLEDNPLSHITVAAIIANSDIGSYPTNIPGAAVFDFDYDDIAIPEMIFLKNNHIVGVSIENLNNFRTEKDAKKKIEIDRVIKYIERNLEFSEVKGRLYNKYVVMNIYDKLDIFLKEMIKGAIVDYSIKNISFVPTELRSGYIRIEMSIIPKNSLEQLEMLMEV